MEQQQPCFPIVLDRSSPQSPFRRPPGDHRPQTASGRLPGLPPARRQFVQTPEFHALFASARHYRYPKGTAFRDDAGLRQISYLVSGIVAFRSPGGRLLDLLHAGEFFDEAQLFGSWLTEESRSHAYTECSVLKLEASQFIELAGIHPELWSELARQLSARLSLQYRRSTELWSEPADQRVWNVLKRLAQLDQAPLDRGCHPLLLRRCDLGDLAGCARKHAGVIVQALVDQGRIETRGHRILVPRAAL